MRRLSASASRQGCFIRQDRDFVNIIGDKYLGKSYEFLTILVRKIECEAIRERLYRLNTNRQQGSRAMP
jgi:hypothetical protein